MSPPPYYLLARKLINRYFKNHLKTNMNEENTSFMKIVNCWQNNGIESSICNEYIEQYEVISKDNFKTKKEKKEEITPLKIVLNSLNKPKKVSQFKGRFRDENQPRFIKNIYDGII